MSEEKVLAVDGEELRWVICPECGYEQADMGNNVACENCGEGPMPTTGLEEPDDDGEPA